MNKLNLHLKSVSSETLFFKWTAARNMRARVDALAPSWRVKHKRLHAMAQNLFENFDDKAVVNSKVVEYLSI